MWVAARRLGVLTATVVALSVFAGSASAATVSMTTGGTPTITYQASAGETNNTTVTRPGSGSAADYIFTQGAPLTAGANCTQTSTNVVTCNTTTDPNLVANLLDQNDTFSASGVDHLGTVTFNGGDGNDTLNGSNFDDYFDGQAGSDTQDCKGGTNDMYKLDGADPAPVNCETAVP